MFSGLIYANVGASDEIMGNTGIAHVFEHMAFKGTTTIGTKDYEKEKVAMDKMDTVFDKLRAEWAKGARAEAETVEQLQTEFEALQEEAAQYSKRRRVRPNFRTGRLPWGSMRAPPPTLQCTSTASRRINWNCGWHWNQNDLLTQ